MNVDPTLVLLSLIVFLPALGALVLVFLPRDKADALKLFETTKPDVAVIDISLKTGNGIDLIKRIKDRNDDVRMLVWSMYNDSLYAERALRAGAVGYINKAHATDKIVDAIRHVLDGRIYVSEQIADKFQQTFTRVWHGSAENDDFTKNLQMFNAMGSFMDMIEDKDLPDANALADVTSASDGGATFEFFDDFEGTSLDTGKWSGNTG